MLRESSSFIRRPNIVYILADDMGYGDLSCLNENAAVRTPNLDRMAARGMSFTDAHSSSAVYTPSRYSILTGRYMDDTSHLPAIQLYDLWEDIGERENVRADFPEVEEELTKLFSRYVLEDRSTPGAPQPDTRPSHREQLNWEIERTA
ncbi:sulfatase-like hydrolase/transferase [Puniceicoccus vermicola]|nr:sulfatase-like hydrolase/transferase [Puniceicoccus vermicola]